MPTVEVTDATFERDVLRSERPVLVDFWAPWCSPCKAVAPVLESLSDEFAGQLTIAKVNVDDNPAIAGRLRIQSIPTMVLFENGAPTEAVQGAQPKDKLEALVRSWLPAAAKATIEVEELAQLVDAGRRVHVLDLRRELDYDRSHLLGARCVSEQSLTDELRKIPAEEPVVLVCRTGEISEEQAKQLASPGRVVRALAKGLLEWEGRGKPTYSTKEEAALHAEG